MTDQATDQMTNKTTSEAVVLPVQMAAGAFAAIALAFAFSKLNFGKTLWATADALGPT